MKVIPFSNRNINNKFSFKSARVSVNAVSDTHGNLLLANNALELMKERKNDVFLKNEVGNANIFAVIGDWFIDGAQTGYYSNPSKPKGLFQLDFLNKFIEGIKGIAKNTTTLFTLGNHELDGEVALLDKTLSSLDAQTVVTNLQLPNSNGLSNSISNGKVVNQKIIEVQDDKNSNLKHKLLFLGVMPVNLKYYQPNCAGISLINNTSLSQREVKQEDYSETLIDCKERITKFKEEHPNGIVVLMSHTGVDFADNLAKIAPVNLVFDGHEHKDGIRSVNGAQIVSMSQNFKRLINAQISIDDEGKLEHLNISKFNPTKYKGEGELLEFYSNLFSEDVKGIYSLKSTKADITELGLDGLRNGNNFLANFVTDSILSEIKEKESDVDFFALNSAAIRQPLKIAEGKNISNFDVLNVLSGIREDDGKVLISEVTGKEVFQMILDNVLSNSNSPQNNPIMQYSGLSIDKTSLLNALGSCTEEDLYSFIIDTNSGKPISPEKTYKIANVEKYFNKSKNKNIKQLKAKSYYLGNNIQELFSNHFKKSQEPLVAKCDIRYK